MRFEKAEKVLPLQGRACPFILTLEVAGLSQLKRSRTGQARDANHRLLSKGTKRIQERGNISHHRCSKHRIA
jgi:hypothetical protein